MSAGWMKVIVATVAALGLLTLFNIALWRRMRQITRANAAAAERERLAKREE